jgi:hypothetical protein
MNFFEKKSGGPKPPINTESPEKSKSILDHLNLLTNKTQEDGTLSLTQKVFAKLLTEPENSSCIDCGKINKQLYAS